MHLATHYYATAIERQPMNPGRNDPCPCGSGKKYKHCCGAQVVRKAEALRALTPLRPQQIAALVTLVEQDRLAEAESQTRTQLRCHPDAGLLWKVLSVALVRQGKEALDALRQAARLLPGDAEAHRNLGAALHDRGEWAAALESLNAALELEPGDANAMLDAANALRALKRAHEAIPLYQRALAIDPRLGEAANNLGNAYLELGRHAEALDAYRNALAIRPDNVQILCNIGTTLAELGRRPEAVASYRRALARDPGCVDALNGLGNVLRDLGERVRALELYDKAIECEPGRAESHCNRGNALFEFRRMHEAVASYRRSIALQADYAPAHLSLGMVFRQQRQPAAAEASCRESLALDPDFAEAMSFMGELVADRGRFVDAEQWFLRAIAANPAYPYAYAGIATHRRMTSGDASWRKDVESLLAKPLPLAAETALRYALGKYFDDCGSFALAFDSYRLANESAKRLGVRYDAARFSRYVDSIMSRFDRGWMCRRHEACSDSERPVFIIGMPRSGTSLAEQILASHPAVYGAGELSFWRDAFRAMQSVATSGSGAGFGEHTADDYLRALAAIEATALRVVDKMPANFLYVGLIHAVFPQARIIHMRRHPLDTCLSIYFQNFFNMGPYANDLDDLAHYYRGYRRITDHWRLLLPASALLEVPYEALVEEPEAWSRRIVEFIGLPWDDKCLDFHQTDRVVVTASKWQVRQKISSSSVGRWKHYEEYIGPLLPLLELQQPA